ncbi:hypothetical protein PsYK624_163660 [Phanerochaete sordida]|uniref:F-box domain-containing protein n=1 Tax=Phanerochaete sordida TaxID=48140 RepID=A0A9P3GRZ0_9APHY|nr:hypothetical protein PsYK624_163660 [Phanerochaete sordida]
MSNDISGPALPENTCHIISLPIEVLQTVLCIVLTDTFWEASDRHAVAETTTATIRTKLQLVCKHWYSSVLGCSQMWAFLDLYRTPAPAVRRAIMLSGETSLSVKATSYREWPYTKPDFTEEPNAELLAELLAFKANRIVPVKPPRTCQKTGSRGARYVGEKQTRWRSLSIFGSLYTLQGVSGRARAVVTCSLGTYGHNK